MTIKNILGLILLSLPFIGLTIYIGQTEGWICVLYEVGLLCGVIIWVFAIGYLLDSDN